MLTLTPLKAEAIIGAIIVLLLVLAFYIHKNSGVTKQLKEGTGLGIYDVVTQVKSELVKASNDGTAPMFKVKSFDLDINFVVKDQRSENAGIKTEVVSIGGEAGTSSERTQRITLHMETIEEQVRQTGADQKPSNVNPTPLSSPPPPKKKGEQSNETVQ